MKKLFQINSINRNILFNFSNAIKTTSNSKKCFSFQSIIIKSNNSNSIKEESFSNLINKSIHYSLYFTNKDEFTNNKNLEKFKNTFPSILEDFEKNKVVNISSRIIEKLEHENDELTFNELNKKEDYYNNISELDDNLDIFNDITTYIDISSNKNININNSDSDNSFNNNDIVLYNKSLIKKQIKGIINKAMSLNIENIEVKFSKYINDNQIKGFILNQIYCCNYLPEYNSRSYIDLFNYTRTLKPSLIKNLYLNYDDYVYNISNYLKITYKDFYNITNNIVLAKSNYLAREYANTRPNIADCNYIENICHNLINKLNSSIKHKQTDYKNNLNYTTHDIMKIIDNENINLSSSVDIEVIKGEQLLNEDMKLFYSVGKSAKTEPRLIILKYVGFKNELDSSTTDYSHCILGKGLVFDNGGVNLKPTGYIEDMFIDKHGACNALSVFEAIVKLGLKVNLICALAVAENAIDSNSYKPSEIITSRKGLTVEVGNTDAEGRLCLADSLTYIQDKYKPSVLIDVATLTGACMVALGNNTAGVFCNNNSIDVCKDILKASK